MLSGKKTEVNSEHAPAEPYPAGPLGAQHSSQEAGLQICVVFSAAARDEEGLLTSLTPSDSDRLPFNLFA